jgi:spermidine synthase
LVWVYGAWSFLASLLIFWVELMVAKMLLPRFGGSPSVWNTALVFFQVNLLAGYAGAHFLARLDGRRHKLVQVGLVAVPALTLPIALPALLDGQGLAPAVAVLAALTLMVGAPFFALSTSTPTLQAWFAHSSHLRASDPYFLYALSNVGSLIGLLGYPTIIERALPLRAQTTWWAIGYGVFALLTVWGARLVGRWDSPPALVIGERPTLRRRMRWAAVAFVPSLALLGVTRHISTDVAAFPLLWTIPLALYLASFVLTFRDDGARWTRLGEWGVRILIVPAALGVLYPNLLWLTITVPLALLTAVSLAAHGRVYRDRPSTHSLTDFYLWVSIGGAAGGLFASLVAPLVFDFIVEYPLTLVLAALLAGPAVRHHAPDRRLLVGVVVAAIAAGVVATDSETQLLALAVAGVVVVVWGNWKTLALGVAAILIASSLGETSYVLTTERTFFGVYRVHEASGFRYLMSGNTLHGAQLVEQDPTIPVSYYHSDGPAGDMFQALPGRAHDIGIVGLGVGSLTAYGESGDRLTYYEIDPVVEDLARDQRFFTYLSGSDAIVDVVIGDGRLELERLGPSHDLIVIDAFSSDAIPVHLLTLEAFQSYFESLDPGGALLVHVSNRHLDLEPVVGRIAEELGATARIRDYTPGPGVDWSSPSRWVVVEQANAPLDLPETWVLAEVGDTLWTDDYSNILSVVDWD